MDKMKLDDLILWKRQVEDEIHKREILKNIQEYGAHYEYDGEYDKINIENIRTTTFAIILKLTAILSQHWKLKHNCRIIDFQDITTRWSRQLYAHECKNFDNINIKSHNFENNLIEGEAVGYIRVYFRNISNEPIEGQTLRVLEVNGGKEIHLTVKDDELYYNDVCYCKLNEWKRLIILSCT